MTALQKFAAKTGFSAQRLEGVLNLKKAVVVAAAVGVTTAALSGTVHAVHDAQSAGAPLFQSVQEDIAAQGAAKLYEIKGTSVSEAKPAHDGMFDLTPFAKETIHEAPPAVATTQPITKGKVDIDPELQAELAKTPATPDAGASPAMKQMAAGKLSADPQVLMGLTDVPANPTMLVNNWNFDVAAKVGLRADAELAAIGTVVDALSNSDAFLDEKIPAADRAAALMDSMKAAVASAGGEDVAKFDGFEFKLASTLPPHGAIADAVDNLNWKRQTIVKATNLTQDMVVAFYSADPDQVAAKIEALEDLMKDVDLSSALDDQVPAGPSADVGEQQPGGDIEMGDAPEVRNVSMLGNIVKGAGALAIIKGVSTMHPLKKLKDFVNGDDDKPAVHHHQKKTTSM